MASKRNTIKVLRHWLIVPAVLLAAGLLFDAAAAQRPRDGVRDSIPTRPRADVPVRPPAPNTRVRTRPPIADALEGVFANGLQRRLELNDDQLNRIRPALRDSLQRRNRLAQESLRLRREINQALRENRSAEDIDDLISELDRSDRELREAREDFFRAADPELSPRQRAMLRYELPNIEEQIRSMIERTRRQQP